MFNTGSVALRVPAVPNSAGRLNQYRLRRLRAGCAEANAEHSSLSARRTSRGIPNACGGPPLKKPFVPGRGQRRVSD